MSWAEHYKEIDSVLSSSELHIALDLYLQYLMWTVKHNIIIEGVYYATKWAHNTVGLSDPGEADIVRSIVEASKRELNTPIKKKKKKKKTVYSRFNEITVSNI